MNRSSKVSTGVVAAVVAGVSLPVTGLVGLSLLVGGAEQQAAAARACSAPVVVAAGGGTGWPSGPPPNGSVAGYAGVQLANAAEILRAGRDQGLTVRDQTIGVMTAMGESGLRVLNYGDQAGPDSRGLFQQRANGAWGSLADRMDPYRSAWNFFSVLKTVFGRDLIAPTLVAHQVQRNADPYHYERFWAPAAAMVAYLRVAAPASPTPSTGPTTPPSPAVVPASLLTCPPDIVPAGTGGDISVTGVWGQPGAGPVMSPFGMRRNPLTGAPGNMHTGLDLAAGGCGGPIWAAAAGTVSTVYVDNLGGWTVHVDHGGGVSTGYKHMYPTGIYVRVGDRVRAGQRIAVVGSSGFSSGCHLHFEVILNGSKVDPAPFMAARGVRLGA